MFITSFGFSQDQPIDVPKITIKIPLGETVHFEEVSVKFVSVLEDSRCPLDVQCIWAGEAKLVVEINENGKDQIAKELLFNGKQKNILFTKSGYQLRGVALLPYPAVSNSEHRNYTLLVSEETN